MNKPFLKWAGNKYRIINHIIPLVGDAKTFIEPFFGSGAIALNVFSDVFVLNDYNPILKNLHNFIVHDEKFIDDCEDFFKEKNNKADYLNIRDLFNTSNDEREKAILFVYLNRHCFNGLTRYNSSGKFNVPFGKYNSPYFPKREMISYKNHFYNVKSLFFYSEDFTCPKLYKNVNSETVVYFDPPYLPYKDNACFSEYTKNSFGYDDHLKLVDLSKDLHKMGAKVIISNHDTQQTRELYESSFIYSFPVSRTISASTSSRNVVKELLAVWG